jgi:hypothetical protein
MTSYGRALPCRMSYIGGAGVGRGVGVIVPDGGKPEGRVVGTPGVLGVGGQGLAAVAGTPEPATVGDTEVAAPGG